MDLRKSVDGLPEELDTAANWIESCPCPFENAITHAARLRKRSDAIRSALSQPDMLAESVELLRKIKRKWWLYLPPSMEMQMHELVRRYYVAQQEQSNETR